jgi:hypothetical protein
MNHNYYKIADIYKKKVLLEDYTAVSDENSYRTTASMSGPGNGPVNATDGQMSQGGDSVMFPNMQDLSNEQKASLLIKFLKLEIDEGTWKRKTKKKFEDMLDFLLDHYDDEEEEDSDDNDADESESDDEKD